MQEKEKTEYVNVDAVEYVDAILDEPDLVKPPYKVKKKAYENYNNVLVLLAELKGKGKCDFSYDSIREPHVTHCVYIQWKPDEDGFIELDARETEEILSKMETIVIDTKSEYEWQLSSKIFVNTEDIKDQA